jgi:hypothetical protein
MIKSLRLACRLHVHSLEIFLSLLTALITGLYPTLISGRHGDGTFGVWPYEMKPPNLQIAVGRCSTTRRGICWPQLQDGLQSWARPGFSGLTDNI